MKLNRLYSRYTNCLVAVFNNRRLTNESARHVSSNGIATATTGIQSFRMAATEASRHPRQDLKIQVLREVDMENTGYDDAIERDGFHVSVISPTI